MSLILKGMQIPENCAKCGLMCVLRHFNILNDNRPDDCPLIELPEHHGRLIDENEVRTVMNWLLTQPQRPTWNDTYNTIKEMNAVIEAE